MKIERRKVINLKAGKEYQMVIKIGFIGILAVLMALQLRSYKNEYSLYVVFAAGIVIAGYTLLQMQDALAGFGLLQNFIQDNALYVDIMLKMVGITYVCEFSCAICRDAGYQFIAGQIELFGKVGILLLGVPIVNSLLKVLKMM